MSSNWKTGAIAQRLIGLKNSCGCASLAAGEISSRTSVGILCFASLLAHQTRAPLRRLDRGAALVYDFLVAGIAPNKTLWIHFDDCNSAKTIHRIDCDRPKTTLSTSQNRCSGRGLSGRASSLERV